MNMKTIHKHAVPVGQESIDIDLPVGAIIQDIEYLINEKKIFMWVEVTADLNSEKEKRRFRVFKTGDGIPAADRYIGTAIDQYTPEAFHVYEVPTKSPE